jgi:hypothetical protein
MRARAHHLVLAIAVLATGCEGVAIEIVETGFGDGGVGAPGVVEWELRFEPIEGEGCPTPVGHLFDTEPVIVAPGTGVMPIDAIDLRPGRYVVTAIGRDAACDARYYGQTCFGPDAPPRVVMVTTCDVTAPSCVDFAWTDEDRAALACRGVCGAGRCE